MKSKVMDMQRRQKPRWFFEITSGKCFYCGAPTFNHGWPRERDWIFLRPSSEIVREHKIPVIRGGSNERENLTPSCAGCNSAKGSFTADEFRMINGFRSGSLNYRFAFDKPSGTIRDWLCMHSDGFERSIFLHNMPSAAEGYRLRNGWARGPRATGVARLA